MLVNPKLYIKCPSEITPTMSTPLQEIIPSLIFGRHLMCCSSTCSNNNNNNNNNPF